MYSITKSKKFEAAHTIPGHKNPDGSEGKCARLHGHSYEVTVHMSSDILDALDMVLDYSYLGEALGGFVNRVDHTYLNENDLFTDMIPTAEIISLVAYNYVKEYLSNKIAWASMGGRGVTLDWVRVKETQDTEAYYYG